jgi:hypothetical protein
MAYVLHVLVGGMVSAAAKPTVFWASTPVEPGQHVVLGVAGMTNSSLIEVIQGDEWIAAKAEGVTAAGATILVPADYALGQFQVRADGGTAFTVNAPNPWFAFGDGGKSMATTRRSHARTHPHMHISTHTHTTALSIDPVSASGDSACCIDGLAKLSHTLLLFFSNHHPPPPPHAHACTPRHQRHCWWVDTNYWGRHHTRKGRRHRSAQANTCHGWW